MVNQAQPALRETPEPLEQPVQPELWELPAQLALMAQLVQLGQPEIPVQMV